MQTQPPREVFAHFTEDPSNAIHQTDIIYFPHDRFGHKTYKYELTLVSQHLQNRAVNLVKHLDG